MTQLTYTIVSTILQLASFKSVPFFKQILKIIKTNQNEYITSNNH
ncbi:hypothetical protein BH11BAC1_BH11BAC1_09700 [soil metagenome]